MSEGQQPVDQVGDRPSASTTGRPPNRQDRRTTWRPFGSWWPLILALAVAILLGLGSLQLIRLLGRPFALLILALAIASAVAPAAAYFERFLPRAMSIVSVYLLVSLVFGAIGWIAIPPLIEQARQFAGELPVLLSHLEGWLNRWDSETTAPIVDTLMSQLGEIGTFLISLPLAVSSALVELLIILFLSIYALLEAPRARDFALSLFPKRDQEKVDNVLSQMSNAMGGYVRGLLIDGAIVGLLTYLGLLLIGVPFPLVLGLLAALLEIVPYLGPPIAGLIIVGVALLQSTTTALIALVFIVVLQQIESNILVPNIMRTQTHVSPLMIVLALVAGAAVGGLLGALVAIPFAGALRVLVLLVIAPAIRQGMGAPALAAEEDDE